MTITEIMHIKKKNMQHEHFKGSVENEANSVITLVSSYAFVLIIS